MRLYTSPTFRGKWRRIIKGSEPSLGSRNGNHSSSVSASKRTLVSQENMSPNNRQGATESPLAANQSSSEPNEADNTTAPATSVLPNVTDLPDDSSFDNSPAKTPSYLNASRLACGYTPYSSYTPPQARNIKVLRKSESESDSSLSKERDSLSPNVSVSRTDEALAEKGQCLSSESHQDNQEPITNGHVVSDHENSGIDLVDSARINTSSSNSNNINAVSRTDSSRPLSNDLDTSRSSCGGVADSGFVENGVLPGEFKLDLHEPPLDGLASPDTPAKDGYYFMDVMRREEKKLHDLCSVTEKDLQNNHGEEVNGKLRAAIGKANLLTSKKFNQFKGLCQKNIEQDASDPFPITPKDLAGFWDMVSIQVEELHAMFTEIERMRQSGWTLVKTPTKSASKGTRKSPRAKSTASSQKATEAAKAREQAREEARKRLLAAKKAGRMRKRSNSDKDGEIEIYVQE